MTDDSIAIAPASDSLADDLAALAAESRTAGVKNVTVLVDRWVAGTERFDGPGEMLLVAWSGGLVVGVGGISKCPDVPGALRVRRFYVGSAHHPPARPRLNSAASGVGKDRPGNEPGPRHSALRDHIEAGVGEQLTQTTRRQRPNGLAA